MSSDRRFGIACKTCRRCGRKCDRTIPRCLSCHQRGVGCEGYTLRWVGLAARGIMVGRRTYQFFADDNGAPREQMSSSASLVARREVSDVTIRGLPQQRQHTALKGQPYISDRNSHSASSPPRLKSAACFQRLVWSIPAGLSSLEEDMVNTFVGYCTSAARNNIWHQLTHDFSDAREISMVFYLGRGPAVTPYTQHILPMANSVRSVRYAVAATASCHIGNKLQNNGLKVHSLRLRLAATKALRQQLQNPNEAIDISNLACMVLLAQLDVCIRAL